MENNDRRIRKTKKALYDALEKLLTEKPLNKITIHELTELADIHRGTFYKHYADIFALYDEIEAVAFASIDEIIQEDPEVDYETVYLGLIDYVYENADLWKILLGKNASKQTEQKLFDLISEKYLLSWEQECNVTATEEMRLVTLYHVRGSIAIIEGWLDSGCAYSKAKMLKLFFNLEKHIGSIEDDMDIMKQALPH